MMLKQMMGKALTQPVWLLCMKYQMNWSTVLFEHLLDLSVWGWYIDDIFSLTPVNSFSIFQKHQRKSLLWSLTMLRGRPFSQYQYSKNRPASSSQWGLVSKGWGKCQRISSQWLSRYSLCHYPSARVQWNPSWCCLPDYLGSVRGARGQEDGWYRICFAGSQYIQGYMKFLGSSTYSASNSSHGEPQHMTFLPCGGPRNLIPARKGLLVLPLLRE